MAMGPDGKIWAEWKRVDPETKTVDAKFDPWSDPNAPPGRHMGYGDSLAVNSKGDPYATDYLSGYIVGVDAKTGAVKWFKLSAPKGNARRGRMDNQDRYWFAMNTADRLGMLDTRTGKVTEWPLPFKYTTPYTMSWPDKKGYVYSSSNTSERLLRLNPKTGEIVEYQMPTEFDAKKLYVVDGVRTSVWMA